MEADRRRSPRFPFVACVDVLGEQRGRIIPTSRTSDLSLSGCYVDTVCPLPQGTPVHIRIFTDTDSFEAPAKVVYSHLHLGMGLAFGEVKAPTLDVLQNWLPREA